MILKPGEYVDISGMTMKQAKKIFPQLKDKDWTLGRYTILFATEWLNGVNLDAYSGNDDRRDVWIQRNLVWFKRICLDDIGEL